MPSLFEREPLCGGGFLYAVQLGDLPKQGQCLGFVRLHSLMEMSPQMGKALEMDNARTFLEDAGIDVIAVRLSDSLPILWKEPLGWTDPRRLD